MISAQSALDRFDSDVLASAAARLLAVAGVIGLALALSKVFWLIAAGPGHEVGIPRAGLAAEGPAILADYSIIERVTPFAGVGVVAPLSDQSESSFSSAPETDLDLTLHGIIVSGEDAGRAVISSSESSQKRYAIGDAVDGAGGATISRIFGDTVLLDRAGVIERLEFTENGELGAIQLVNGAIVATAATEREAPSPAAPAADASSSNVRGSPGNPVAASSRLSGIR